MEQLKPSAETMKQLFQIMNIEMDDLKKCQGEQYFEKEDQTVKMLCYESGQIRDRLEDTIMTLQEVKKNFKKSKVTDPEELHRDITDIYKLSADMAAMSVRLMAIARMGIITSVDLRTIDRG